METLDKTAIALRDELAGGTLSAAALMQECLARIAALEPDIQAWCYLDPAAAMAAAEAADRHRRAGKPLGPLHGLPVGVKDIIDTADMPTEFNSPFHKGRRPDRDAVLVERLRAAGAIVVGKTVTSEFAVYTAGPTRNPHDLARTPGASSSGSAAAVASRMVPLALATQTNGSTIRPASFCGVVGYKPSLGVLPRTGILKHAAIIDQPGLMARNVADAALLAEALRGYDPSDEMSGRPQGASLATAATASGAAPRLAYVRGPYFGRIDASAQAAVEALAERLGAVVTPVELPPEFDSAAEIQGVLMSAGLGQVCRDNYNANPGLMSPVLRGIVERGLGIAAVDHLDAIAARDRLRALYREQFAAFDAILTPATLGIAPLRENGTGDPILASTWTLLGAPALSLPILAGDFGLPLGIQLVGRLDDDAGLLAAAAWLEVMAAKNFTD